MRNSVYRNSVYFISALKFWERRWKIKMIDTNNKQTFLHTDHLGQKIWDKEFKQNLTQEEIFDICLCVTAM